MATDEGNDNKGQTNSPTYAGPPGAWDIDRNDRCAVETGAVGSQKMALDTKMFIAVVRVTATSCMNHG